MSHRRVARSSGAVLHTVSQLWQEHWLGFSVRAPRALRAENIVSANERWEEFRVLASRGPADALCARLEMEGVPAKMEARALESGIEMQYCVLVSASLAHRARWIVAQLPPTDEELDFLATGKLPGQE